MHTCLQNICILSRVHKEKEESVKLPYVLRINCSESHVFGIQILTNEIVADMGTYSLVNIAHVAVRCPLPSLYVLLVLRYQSGLHNLLTTKKRMSL